MIALKLTMEDLDNISKHLITTDLNISIVN